MANRARSVLTPPAMQASTPSLPRAQGPGPAPNVPVIDTGRGMENLADGIEQAALAVQRDQGNRDALKRLQFEQQFQTDAAARAAALDPMTVDYDKLVVQAYTEAGDAIVEAAGDQFHSMLPLEQLRTSVAEATGQANRAAIVARRGAVAAVAEAQYGATALHTLSAIRNDPDGEEHHLAAFATAARDIVPALPGVKAAALALSFGHDAIVAKTQGLALAGRYEEAREYAKANAGALTNEANRTLPNLVTEIEGDHERRYLAVTEGLRQQHRVAIAEATSVSQLEAVGRQIDAQAAAGLYTKREEFLGSLRVSMAARRAQIIEGERDYTAAMRNYLSGTGHDTREQTDLIWKTLQAEQPAGQPLDQQLKRLGQYVSETGWVPTDFYRVVRNAERVKDPALLASAAQIHDAIRTEAKFVDTGVDKDNSRVLLTSALVAHTGMLYDDAAQYVTDALPDNATLASRRERFRDDFKDFDPVAYLQDKMPGADGGWFGRNIPVPPDAADDFSRSLRLFYELNGDKTTSAAAAMQRFTSMYGVTGTADGRERIGKFPIELFFPGGTNSRLTVEQKRTVVGADVRRTLEAYGIKPEIVVGDTEDMSGIPDFDLAADKITEARLSRGERPDYRVLVRNSAGSLVPIPVTLDDGTREYLRYEAPDITKVLASPEYRLYVDRADRSWLDALPAGLNPKLINEDIRNSLRGTRGAIQGGVDAVRPLLGDKPDYNLDRRGPILGTR